MGEKNRRQSFIEGLLRRRYPGRRGMRLFRTQHEDCQKCNERCGEVDEKEKLISFKCIEMRNICPC
jgi:hypothetical protein